MADPSNTHMGSSTEEAMARYAPFVGPLVFVALGYMDPGNWATAIEGGSRFGFELLWVVIFSHIMAALFQILATRLELVTGKHLAQVFASASLLLPPNSIPIPIPIP
jgi:NRAMP (natural resistance-associated macrophage protein)-like metal ion transporter